MCIMQLGLLVGADFTFVARRKSSVDLNLVADHVTILFCPCLVELNNDGLRSIKNGPGHLTDGNFDMITCARGEQQYQPWIPHAFPST
jgi:hypothetical protein